MKALIITYYWPPAGGSGVQRWLKFAKYLRDFGIEPIIYTAQNPNYPIEDESLQKDIPKGIEVLKQPIWEPNSIFAKSSKKTSAGFLNSNPSFFGKIAQYIRANYFIPDARKFWIKPSINYLSKYLKSNHVDIVISTGPPHSMHLIGLGLKEKLNIKWIADFRDPWTEIDYFHQLPLTQNSRKNHFQLEEEVLKKADKVLVVGNTMAENYRKISDNVQVITNGYDSESNDEIIHLDTKFSLVHIGMLNADRNHEILWESLDELCNTNNSFSEDLELKFIGKLANEVRISLKQYDLERNVEVIDYLPHKEISKHQKSAQVLLLLINNVPSSKGIVTGKVFEYLQAKRPILAIAPHDGDLARILDETRAGTVVNFIDKEKLKEKILEFYVEFKQQTLKSDSINIEQFHRKSLTKVLSKIITEVVN